jgi:hypothetical protein
VNTHAEYRRHLQESSPTTPAPLGDDDANQLALRRDPSLSPAGPALTTAPGRSIAWVRPTELHSYANAAVGRGIDLQAELARRSLRAPHVIARSARRAIPNLDGRGPAVPTSCQEGLQP